MRKLTTLHIDSEKNWGGGQRQVAGLCSYLREQGHVVKIVCRPNSQLQRWAGEKGIEAIPVEMKCVASLASVLNLRKAIKRENPDVVHLHASRAHVLGSAAAALAGAKVRIATRRMDNTITMKWPNTSAYGKWTTDIVAISSAVRDVIVDCGVDASKIHLIESGADVTRFESAKPDPQLRANLGISDSVPLVCAAAILAERKGIKHLIRAASILKARSTPVHLMIAGDGEQRAELEALAKELDVSASFLGFYEDMPALMASIDVFVMASLTEGLGVAVLEAMAAGKPVVASAVGGLRESTVHGVTGYHVPPEDPEALAEEIGKLVTNPTMAREFGAAGHARAKEIYSIENMARRNEALYYELVGKWESLQL